MAKRLNVNLSDEVAAVLENMAEQDRITVTEAVRRCISTEAFLREAKSLGKRFLLKEPESEQLTEVVFR